MKKIGIITIVIALVMIIIAVLTCTRSWLTNNKEEVAKTVEQSEEQIIATSSLTINEKKDIANTLAANWDLTKVAIVEDTNGIKVPVPIGYTASKVKDGEGNYIERTVDGGFVIYEGTEEVEGTYTVEDNIPTMDENVKTAQYNRNQWVWIPVYDVSEMYGIDGFGKMRGKTYYFSEKGRTSTGWSENANTGVISEYYNHSEPTTVDRDSDAYINVGKMTECERAELEKELTENYEKTIDSIKRYGGFYIGRYETGELSSTAKVVKLNTDINGQGWYTLYKKCRTLNGINTNVVASMIYGSEWDRVLEWLVETECKMYEEVGVNSTTWGNYINTRFLYVNTSGTKVNKSSSTKIPSGSTEYTKANNIYDLAGNLNEWTMEVRRNAQVLSWGRLHK